jgi:nucleotide-binding universal stress UspA family protein
MAKHMLLATDGSELGDKAVFHGLELAKALGAKATIVTVTDMIPTGPYSPIPWPSDIARYEALAARSARKLLDRARDAAQKLGVSCETIHIADERPADGILKACHDQKCDLIVMGSHGRRGIDRLLMGSQAMKVVTLSDVPVLIHR